MLHLRAHDLPGLLEHGVVVPQRVELAQHGGEAVVLPRPDQVHRRQVQVLVRAVVAWGEDDECS